MREELFCFPSWCVCYVFDFTETTRLITYKILGSSALARTLLYSIAGSLVPRTLFLQSLIFTWDYVQVFVLLARVCTFKYVFLMYWWLMKQSALYWGSESNVDGRSERFYRMPLTLIIETQRKKKNEKEASSAPHSGHGPRLYTADRQQKKLLSVFISEFAIFVKWSNYWHGRLLKWCLMR